jgi:rhodanese-related sulfurtransferase
MAATVRNGTRRITPVELDAARRRDEPIVVLDVRRREAWTGNPSRIPGAIWLPLEEVPQRTRDLPRDAHLVVYCA